MSKNSNSKPQTLREQNGKPVAGIVARRLSGYDPELQRRTAKLLDKEVVGEGDVREPRRHRNLALTTLGVTTALLLTPTGRDTAVNIGDAFMNIGPNSEAQFDQHNTNTNLVTNQPAGYEQVLKQPASGNASLIKVDPRLP